jgi:type I restriction enzyme M protein
MERMPQTRQSSTAPTNDGATVGYEAQLWQTANALRGSMDAAEYKHVMLGLIFLKYISDAFKATDGGVFGGFGGNK